MYIPTAHSTSRGVCVCVHACVCVCVYVCIILCECVDAVAIYTRQQRDRGRYCTVGVPKNMHCQCKGCWNENTKRSTCSALSVDTGR